jgi:hypothetical protein
MFKDVMACPPLLTFGSSAFALATGVLTAGCLPEPFFVVICPAVIVLGFIATVVGAVEMIVC